MKLKIMKLKPLSLTGTVFIIIASLLIVGACFFWLVFKVMKWDMALLLIVCSLVMFGLGLIMLRLTAKRSKEK